LKPGNTVLEIGAGTGRNFPYLVEAVGPSGTVIGVDASPGMLAEARKLIERRGWSNVQLLHQDATQLEVDRDVDGVLFSLSYSALPEPRPALARAWECLRPSSRVVVMDMGLTQGGPHRLLAPIGRLHTRRGGLGGVESPMARASNEGKSKAQGGDLKVVHTVQAVSPGEPGYEELRARQFKAVGGLIRRLALERNSKGGQEKPSPKR